METERMRAAVRRGIAHAASEFCEHETLEDCIVAALASSEGPECTCDDLSVRGRKDCEVHKEVNMARDPRDTQQSGEHGADNEQTSATAGAEKLAGEQKTCEFE